MTFTTTMTAMKAAHAAANVFESMQIADAMDTLAMKHAGITPWVEPTFEELAAKRSAEFKRAKDAEHMEEIRLAEIRRKKSTLRKHHE